MDMDKILQEFNADVRVLVDKYVKKGICESDILMSFRDFTLICMVQGLISQKVNNADARKLLDEFMEKESIVVNKLFDEVRPESGTFN